MKYAKKMMVAMLFLAPVIALAQLGNGDRVVAQVPFRFMVADQNVPAGEYILQKADASGKTLAVRNVDAKVGIFVLTSVGESKEAAGSYALVFNRYGNRYFLSALKVAGDRTTYSPVESKEEAELRAQNVPATQQVVLAQK